MQQSKVISDLYLRKTRAEKLFSKCSVFKFSLSPRKRKVGVFKFLRFEQRFRKALFKRRIKLRFQVSPAWCQWTEPLFKVTGREFQSGCQKHRGSVWHDRYMTVPCSETLLFVSINIVLNI